jgi:drug/metabolite transporter (DMT)-like permease
LIGALYYVSATHRIDQKHQQRAFESDNNQQIKGEMGQHERVRPLLPYLAFALCASIWGSTFLFIRFSNEVMPPMWASSLRLVLAGAILSLFLVLTKQPFPRGAALRAAIWYGGLSFGVNFPLLYWGETLIPSGLAAVLYATIPISSVVIASWFGLEKLDFRRLGAATIAVSGVAVIFWREVGRGENGWGILAVFTAAIVAALGAMMLKRGPKQSAIAANAIATLTGVPFCLCASFIMAEERVFPTSASQWGPLLYLTIAGSIGAFVIFAWLLGQWRATSVTFIAVIVPIIAVILGAIFLKESLAPGSWIGAVIVIGATAFALLDDRRKNGTKPASQSEPSNSPRSTQQPEPASSGPC